MSPSGLDRIARELAAGEISRRSALKRLAGAGLGIGAAVAPAGVADAMGGGCPAGRVKCDGKCCPKNAKCKQGKCKCKAGYKKCGRKCVDVNTSVKHCGDCGQPCAEGETCVGGVCSDPGLCDGVVCEALDQCHNAGVCDPETGSCSNPEKPNGTSCDDGNECTHTDVCTNGACAGTPYSCDDGHSCTSDACDGLGGCTSTINAGNCLIDGVCYSENQPCPGGFCFPFTSQTTCTIQPP